MKPALLSSLSILARQACVGLLLLLLGHSAAWGQQPAAASDPRLDWSDVTRFWQTMDRLASATSRADSLQLVQTQYLDPASAGLRAYVEAAHATPADLLAAWRTHRQYLAAIRPATLQLKAQEPAIRQAMRELRKVYPAAVIPAVYFGVGKFEVGGTAFPGALYIGAELKCASPHPPLEELRPDVRPNVSAVTTVSTPCIHEIIHVQQQLRGGTTNLDGALLEGAAEYLAYRFTGRLGANAAFAYGNQHEAEVRRQFAQEASQPIAAKWFVATTEAGSSLPGALGYFVGFKICEAYYAQAADKPAALRQLLTLSQPAELLAFGRKYLSR